MKKLQVFISSTYKDLREERQAAVEAILKAGHIPAGMELFSAGDESQLETIRRWIDESDVYMLILGGRYGSVEPKASLSYTELEYDYAVENGKPSFAVVITDLAIEKKAKKHGREFIETDYGKELKMFRDKVLGKTTSFFDDPKDIKLAVHETLSDFLFRKEFVGWIPGDEIQKQNQLLEEIAELRKNNTQLLDKANQLQRKLDRIRDSDKGGWTDEFFNEIASLLLPIEITTGQGEDANQVPLMNLVLRYRDRLVSGIYNQHGTTDLDRLLFFNVCPKLEIHGLVESEKVAGVTYRRKSISAKGKAFLAFIERRQRDYRPEENARAKSKKHLRKKSPEDERKIPAKPDTLAN